MDGQQGGTGTAEFTPGRVAAPWLAAPGGRGTVHGGSWRYMAVHGDTTGSYLVQQRLDGRQRSCEAREQWQYDDVEELWRDTCVVVHSKEAGGH